MAKSDETEVDFAALKHLYSKSPVAAAFLDDVAGRTYNMAVTKVERLEGRLRRAGHKFSRREVVDMLKELADTGCGVFKTGRRGLPTRLEWSAQMISVAEAAKGEATTVRRLDPSEQMPEDEDDTPAGLLRHPYRLRPDLSLNFELPSDLTANEAVRLAEFIKTLPFSGRAGG